MNFSQLKQAMGIFPNRQAAEQALKQLKDTGFSLDKVSVIAENQAIYNQRVLQGDYLMIIEGTEKEIRRVGMILNSRGIQQWRVYDAPRKVDHSLINASSRQPVID
jgi:hypothetical protein